MKCPNCRCVVPGSMKYCSYCGFRFDNGSARTVSVTEAYSGRLVTGTYRKSIRGIFRRRHSGTAAGTRFLLFSAACHSAAWLVRGISSVYHSAVGFDSVII